MVFVKFNNSLLLVNEKDIFKIDENDSVKNAMALTDKLGENMFDSLRLSEREELFRIAALSVAYKTDSKGAFFFDKPVYYHCLYRIAVDHKLIQANRFSDFDALLERLGLKELRAKYSYDSVKSGDVGCYAYAFCTWNEKQYEKRNNAKPTAFFRNRYNITNDLDLTYRALLRSHNLEILAENLPSGLINLLT